MQSVPPNMRAKKIQLWKLSIASQPETGRKFPLPPCEALEALPEAPEQRSTPWMLWESSSSRCLEQGSPHHEERTKQKREEIISLSPTPPLQVCWGAMGKLASGGLASAPSGTAATELDSVVGAGASLAGPAVLVQHWCQQQVWFLVWGFGNNFPQVRSLARKL